MLRKSLSISSTLKSSFRRLSLHTNNQYRSFSQISTQDREDHNSVLDGEINCLMLHPVSWPNHGPTTELYLAEEAIGLVASLSWNVIKGPKWDGDLSEEYSTDEELDVGMRHELGGPVVFDKRENLELFKKEGIVSGDYVYGPDLQGVYFKGGVILDLADDAQLRSKDEWSDVTLRESVAKSSLVRCR